MKTLTWLFLLCFYATDYSGFAQPHKQFRNRKRSTPPTAQPVEPPPQAEAEDARESAPVYHPLSRIQPINSPHRKRSLRKITVTPCLHDTHREELIHLQQSGRCRSPLRSYYSPRNKAVISGELRNRRKNRTQKKNPGSRL
jgi:hypothetical protein